MRTLLTGCRLFTGESMADGLSLLIEDGLILDLLPDGAEAPGAERRRLPEGAILAPGFIDAQVNGAGGVLFNRTPTREAALAIARAMRPFGTTGLLPTFITDRRDGQRAACAAALEAAADPRGGVLGIHIEGPFLSEARRGVHQASFIRPPDADDLAEICGLARSMEPHGARVLLTLAPEAVEDTAIRGFAEAGVVLSAGHTAASFERVGQALAAGVRGFTHLGNAMPPVVNREPGPVGAALADRNAWCGLIVDGVHVHPGLLRVMLAAKPPGTMFLVTDAMDPVGTDADRFELYGQTILRRDGRLVTLDGTLAGADIDMASAVRNCVTMLGLPLEEALRMASLYPARFLRLDGRFGRLAPGLRADLVLITEEVEVLATWVAGAEEWHGQEA
ncbi:N-acetylglucosamine-6-phosphate deacetylase [Azospirillum sp. SYSU D00513]|uniref:N-acetylglucosamine-6-phosphate deacetylase n=1 Tax=Azospirillum sp. SYSU D00513 TaxID=2812561 RepID=UPI001A977187|nr:N-acetylglucosamine-6-phosphate deacetylase [Azospirillum sp. SYSU D00513]